MALPSALYIAFQGVQTYFLNKDDGSPLSGGSVKFFSDVNRTVPKDVYQQVQLADNTYNFVNIGSVVTLTSVGTFGSPSDGTDIQVYAFPYAGTVTVPGDIELYYLEIYSSTGVLQETREAQPANAVNNTNPTDTFEASENLISNPQFVEVLFTPDPASGNYTYAATGTMEVAIAPGWSIVTSGSGNVVLKQTAVSDPTVGSNPPYFLDVNTTGSISSVKLRQRYQGDPRLLLNGFVSTTIEAASVSSEAILFQVNYVPSAGTYSQTLLSKFSTNNTQFSSLSETVSTTGAGESTATAPTAYVDIEIVWPALKNIQITSIQIASVQNASSSVEFIEQSTARQVDHLFHYYKPQLEYKPIPSYLVGWDFPLNPAQPLTSTVAVSATGANKSRYIWDQTIAFQTVSNSLSFSRDTNTYGFKIAATALTTSFAIIQYLDTTQARELLSQRNAVQLKGFLSSGSGTLVGTVGLYWTTDASLPVLTTGTNNSIVSSITAGAGSAPPVTLVVNGNWNQVSRGNLGDSAPFTLTTTNTVFDFTGFDATATAGKTTATFFAIVITFNTMPITQTVTLDYCSLVGGDIATRPAPQTINAAYNDCYYYYQKSFPLQTLPAQNAGTNGAENAPQTTTNPTTCMGPLVIFPVTMRIDPTVVLFNPSAANAQIRNLTTATDFSASTVVNITSKGFTSQGTPPGGGSVGDFIAVQWTADARLGLF